MRIRNAKRHAEKYKGRYAYTFHVVARWSVTMGPWWRPTDRETVREYTIIAQSGADACNEGLRLALDEVIRTGALVPVDAETRGPKGGRTYRYAGWNSVISGGINAAHSARRQAVQLPLEANS